MINFLLVAMLQLSSSSIPIAINTGSGEGSSYGLDDYAAGIGITIEIAPGVEMPVINNGACFFPNKEDPRETVATTKWIDGGRGLDTAYSYNNQVVVGKAIAAASPAVRKELFQTTKVPGGRNASYALQIVKADIAMLGVKTVDLVLMHSPGKGGPGMAKRILDTYAGLEQALDEGLTRAIGVSNFKVVHLNVLKGAKLKHKPSVNQCFFAVGNHNDAAVALGKTMDITYAAYSPLGPFCEPVGNCSKPVLVDPTVKAITKKHNVSSAEVAMRWIVQQGHAIVTASAVAAYDVEDITGIFKFGLTADEMAKLTAFNSTAAGTVAIKTDDVVGETRASRAAGDTAGVAMDQRVTHSAGSRTGS